MTNPELFSMDQALVSVIIPVFNGEKYIRCAIDSVLEQDYQPIEIIVIDDGSSDATLDILRDLGNEISIYQQPNKGSAAARNLGIRMAKGSYIAFLDADDYWFPGKIRAQMKALQATGCKMAFSRFLFWNVSDDDAWPDPASLLVQNPAGPEENSLVEPRWVYADLLLDCVVWTSTVLIYKEELNRIGGFNEDLRKGQDYELWLRLSKSVQMAFLAQVTALYRIHHESITHAPSTRCYEYEIISKAVRNWGIIGPDGRSPGKKAVIQRIRRAAYNFSSSHWKWGDTATGMKFLRLLRREYGLGFGGFVLYARMLMSYMHLQRRR
jgi:glycosyltransferase involved in cell wall biosynthesis